MRKKTSFFIHYLALYIIVLYFILQQLNINMPLISNNYGSNSHQSALSQRVKQQQVSFGQQNSSFLSNEAINNLQNNELNQGRWNQNENFKFIIFVNYYQDIFSSRYKRKFTKIFRTLSQYLSGRTPDQCRSHYQKLIIKHKSIAKLKKYYKQFYGDKIYNDELEKFKNLWGENHPQNYSVFEQKEVKQIAIQTEPIEIRTSCEMCESRSNSNIEVSNIPNSPSWVDYNGFQSMPYLSFMYWVPSANP